MSICCYPLPVIPHTTSPEWPEGIAPSRFAAHIHAVPVGCRVALLGLPDDLGVRLNNGRPGAAQGPTAFRAALSRYGVANPMGFEWPRVFDAGDIVPAEGDSETALHQTHERVTEATLAILDLGMLPVAVGGGHDLTYPFVRAVAQRHPLLSGVYFDAHLDVRDSVGSGMPFRRLIEDCGVRALDVYGINPFVNSREHVAWFESHGGTIRRGLSKRDLLYRSFKAEGLKGGFPPDLFVSFDMDVLNADEAPGVSAINPVGKRLSKLVRSIRMAGRSPSVRCFDIMELNPAHDVDGRTARAAAHVFLSFLAGFARRTREGIV